MRRVDLLNGQAPCRPSIMDLKRVSRHMSGREARLSAHVTQIRQVDKMRGLRSRLGCRGRIWPRTTSEVTLVKTSPIAIAIFVDSP